MKVLHIAQQLNLSRETVYWYLARSEPPRAKLATYGGRSKLDPHKSYLVKRWNEGIRNASQLHRELVEGGVEDISASTVKAFVTQLRRAKGYGRGFKARKTSNRSKFELSAIRPKAITAKQVARLWVSLPEHLKAEQKHFLARLVQTSSQIERCYELVGQFCEMVKARRGGEFEDWLGAVEKSEIAELMSFARHLRRDKAAVVAGLTLEWSQGQVEGQVNRLKLLKRQMYGQAGFELLKKRWLYQTAAA
jgi:transposase